MDFMECDDTAKMTDALERVENRWHCEHRCDREECEAALNLASKYIEEPKVALFLESMLKIILEFCVGESSKEEWPRFRRVFSLATNIIVVLLQTKESKLWNLISVSGRNDVWGELALKFTRSRDVTVRESGLMIFTALAKAFPDEAGKTSVLVLDTGLVDRLETDPVQTGIREIVLQIRQHAEVMLANKLGFQVLPYPEEGSTTSLESSNAVLGKRTVDGNIKTLEVSQVRLDLDFAESISRFNDLVSKVEVISKEKLRQLGEQLIAGRNDYELRAALSQSRRKHLQDVIKQCSDTLVRICEVGKEFEGHYSLADRFARELFVAFCAKCPWATMEIQLQGVLNKVIQANDLKNLTLQEVNSTLIYFFGEDFIKHRSEWISDHIVESLVRLHSEKNWHCDAHDTVFLEGRLESEGSALEVNRHVLKIRALLEQLDVTMLLSKGQLLVSEDPYSAGACQMDIGSSSGSANPATTSDEMKTCQHDRIISILAWMKLQGLEISQKRRAFLEGVNHASQQWTSFRDALQATLDAIEEVEDNLLQGKTMECLIQQQRKAQKEVKIAAARQEHADSDDDEVEIRTLLAAAQAKLDNITSRLSEVGRLGIQHLPEISFLIRKTFADLLPGPVKAVKAMRSLKDYHDVRALNSGRLFTATHTQTGGPCVLKKFQIDDNTLAGLLLHSCAHSRMARHPCVLTVEAIFEDSPGVWFMQCPVLAANFQVCVTNWRDSSCQHKPSAGQLRRFFVDLAQGLAALHSKRIVHCKLNVENLMVTSMTNYESWYPILCDFDDCYVESLDISLLSAIIGRKPDASDLERIDPSSDMLAFGLILKAGVDACGVASPFTSALVSQLNERTPSRRPTAVEVVQYLLNDMAMDISVGQRDTEEMRKVKTMTFDIRVKALLDNTNGHSREERVLIISRDDPLAALKKFAYIFREDLKMNLKVSFKDEIGDDVGGLLREFANISTEAVMNQCFEDHVEDGGQVMLPKHGADVEILEAFGMLLNKAMQTKVQLSEWHKFPVCLCRFLLLQTYPGDSEMDFWQQHGSKLGLTMSDLEEFKGEICARSVLRTLVLDSDSLCEGSFELPNGQAVRSADREEFVKWQIFQQLLGEARWPCVVALWKGFHHRSTATLVSNLALLHADEVPVLLGGAKVEPTMELLLGTGLLELQAFPPAMNDAVRGALCTLNGHEVKMLLKFMAGLKSVPIHLPGGYLKLTYNPHMSLNGLWVAHSCARTMELPPYDQAHTNPTALRDKLMTSMRESEGFTLV